MGNNTIICDSFRAEALADGRFRIEIVTAPVEAPSPNRRLRVDDVVALVERATGHAVTPATVYRWARMKKNRLPSHKVVGAIVFIEDEVCRWLRDWAAAAPTRKSIL